MKYAILMCLALSGCGVGSDPAPQDKPMVVPLDPTTVLPSPFVIGPSGTAPPIFVTGPAGNQTSTPPVVTFVTGPVTGPVAVVNPPIVVVNPTTPPINWCTDGFVVGPCVPLPKRCQPGEFTVGPCP
jgi:hypothetical protein